MRIAPVLVLVALTGASVDAQADVPKARASEEQAAEPAAATPAPSAGKRVLTTATAVVPGAVVHGAGHFVAGQSDTGYTLLAAQGVGLGMIFAGGSTFFLSGASRYLVGPAAAVTMIGFGLFGVSFAADIYGSASADGGAAERTPRVNAQFESELGYRYISDPRFAYNHFVVESFTFRHEALRITPSAWFATGGQSVRYRVEGAVRLLGGHAGERGKTSDHIDLVLGGIHHRYSSDHFQRTGAEVALDTRYDLAHIGPTLRGAFAEFGFGYGLARINYDLPGRDIPFDTDTVLLGNIGFGAILRGKASAGSEAKIYYDHRHDSFVGGLLVPGLLSGVLGRFGVEGRWFFSERIGLLAEGQMGSALAGGLSLIVREGVFSRREPP